MSQSRYRAAITFFGGLAQRRRPTNGIYQAFNRTYHRHAAGDVLVSYFPWLADPSDVAQALARETVHGRLRQLIVGYSFGGHTAVELCEKLAAVHVPVDGLILCDPVARWHGRFGWSRALVPSTITIPANVQFVTWFYQENPLLRLTPPFLFPRSHTVRRTSVDTAMLYVRSGAEHVDIDNTERFQQEVDLMAGDLLRSAKLTTPARSNP